MMSGKRGIALIMSFFVILVITILGATFFSRVMNENKLVRRYVESARALWLAEAGVAQAMVNLPSADTSGILGGDNFHYDAHTAVQPSTNEYYTIDSTGTVDMGNLGQVQRRLKVAVRVIPIDPTKFDKTIEATGILDVKSAAVYIEDPPGSESQATFIFSDLFQHSKEEVKSLATHHYTDPANNPQPVDGITWVDLSQGNELMITISGGWHGSGILIVAGNAIINGGTFDGIIYVIGTLTMQGNPVIHGTVLVENATSLDEDKLAGTPDLYYDPDIIGGAVDPLKFSSQSIVSWEEMLLP